MRKFLLILLISSLILFGCGQQPSQSKVTVTKISGPEANQTASKAGECSKDSDCGSKITLDSYCFQGNPSGKVRIFKCSNPGTSNSYCYHEDRNEILNECNSSQYCKNGACQNYENCTDSDGGNNPKVYGMVKTSDGATYQDECTSNSRLIEHYCTPDNRDTYKIYSCNCDGGACT